MNTIECFVWSVFFTQNRSTLQLNMLRHVTSKPKFMIAHSMICASFE